MTSPAVYAAVAFGGAAGAFLRFAAGEAASALRLTGFPAATLAVNITGSFLLGVSAALFAGAAHPVLSAGIMKGLCGALTTFSTFSMDTVRLFGQGRAAAAAANALLNLFACFAAAHAGLMLAGGC